MLKYLSIIFGSNVGPLYLGSFSNPILPDIFEKFNIVMLSIGMIIISCTSLISTVNTAQDGKIMGKNSSSFWMPLRSIMGISLMAPMPGSGYSMLQAFVLWVIMQGCNAANQTWELVVDYLDHGISISKAVELNTAQKNKLKTQGEKLTWQLLNSAICMAGMQQIAKGQALDPKQEEIPASQFIHENGKVIQPYQTALNRVITTQKDIEYNGFFNIGIRKPSDISLTDTLKTEYAEICGSYKVKSIVSANELGDSTRSVDIRAKDAAHKKLIALSAIFNSLRPLAEKIAAVRYSTITGNYIPNINEYVKVGGNIYVDIVSGLIKPTKRINQSTNDSIIIEQLRQSDWTAIGALYSHLDKSREIELLNTAIDDQPMPTMLLNTAISTVPSCNMVELQNKNYKNIPELGYLRKYISTEDEADYLCNKLSTVYDSLNYEHNITLIESHHNSQVLKERETTQALGSLQKLINNAFNQLNEETKKSADGNPILSQSNFGNMLISAAEDKLIQASMLEANLATIIPIILWLCGAALVFYVPLIPCIMYTFAVLGWFLLVIENFFVLPIIALGLIMPSRNEIGKIAQNLSLPINTTIRPILMVINFIIAIRLYKVAVELINFVMINSVTINFMNVSLLSPIVALIFYVLFIIISANICFSLSYKIPNLITQAVKNLLTDQEIFVHTEQKSSNNAHHGTKAIPQNMEANTTPTSATSIIASSSKSEAKPSIDPSGLFH